MKASEIKVGEHYSARVSNKLTTVEVLEIIKRDGYKKGSFKMKSGTSYRVKNIATGRETVFKSASKFRAKAVKPTGQKKSPVPVTKPAEEKAINAARHRAEKAHEIKQRAEQQKAIEEKKSNDHGSSIIKAKQTPKVSLSHNGLALTPEQQAIVDVANSFGSVLVIEAGAGAGKTSTLRVLCDVLRGRGQYTAFNNPLVAESKEKFEGTRTACNTTHSLAFRAVGKKYAHRLNGPRVRSEEIAKMLGIEKYELTVDIENDGEKEKVVKILPAWLLAGQVIGALRRFSQSADEKIDRTHFRYIDGIDLPDDNGGRTYTNNRKVVEYLVPYAEAAWKDICNVDGKMPFNHDYYVKIWQLNNPVISADFILLDEAQDTAPVMLDILKQQTVPVILVGDSAQQIYEWRGAVNAMASFPKATRLTLSQSFRFGQLIADVANAVLNTLEHGTDLRIRGFDKINSVVSPIESPRAILCRTNAVAVATLLEGIANGKRPFLVGGGADVTSFVEAASRLQKGESVSHPDLACFSSWKEVQEYVKLDEGEDLKLMVKLIDQFGAEKILDALRNMPEEEKADFVVSTAHKSKGRQWKSVKLAMDFPTVSKCGDADKKLLYVAVTRAQEHLDVSECPFFTGKDSLDIADYLSAKSQYYAENGGAQHEASPITPPTPSIPVTEFSFTKRGDKWLVRGPSGHAGKTVKVSLKNGTTCEKYLKAVEADYGDTAIYKT